MHKNGIGQSFVAGPEATTDHFMRIALACQGISTRTFGGAASRKATGCQVKTTPKEVDGAIFVQERGTKLPLYTHFGYFTRILGEPPQQRSLLLWHDGL